MRTPRFSKGPWRAALSLGQRLYTVANRRGFVASVEHVEDARLVQRAPILYEIVEVLANDLERVANTATAKGSLSPVEQAFLLAGVQQARTTLDEIDGH